MKIPYNMVKHTCYITYTKNFTRFSIKADLNEAGTTCYITWWNSYTGMFNKILDIMTSVLHDTFPQTFPIDEAQEGRSEGGIICDIILYCKSECYITSNFVLHRRRSAASNRHRCCQLLPVWLCCCVVKTLIYCSAINDNIWPVSFYNTCL